MKKIISVFVFILILITGCNKTGKDQPTDEKKEEKEDTNVNIFINDDRSFFTLLPVDGGKTIEIIGYEGKLEVTIPPEIQGLPVTAIGVNAFNRKQLTGVTIPDSVISIGIDAFADNPLTSITIGADVFLDPGFFPSFDIVFNGFKKIYTDNGRAAGTYTYDTDSATWTRQGFSGNEEQNDEEDEEDDENYFTVRTIDGGLAVEIIRYTGSKRRVRIPPLKWELPVTGIGVNAFSRKQLTSVTIPTSVTSIGRRAFADNQLTSVTIGANVTLGAGDYLSFDNGFEDAYADYGKAAGTYTFDTDSATWTKR
jgi:hypothetical protein